MAGTKEGGKAAAKYNKLKHGEDYYSRIAAKATAAWAKNGRKPRGFAAMSPEQRKAAAVKGGRASAEKAKNEKRD